jgi:hypothetical protein
MIREDLENDRKVDLKGRNSDYTIHPKYMKMKECFENIFRKNNLFPNDKFDKNIWFMQNDEKFRTMIRPTSGTTPGQYVNSKMINLLSELSLGGNDMKKLSVEVSKFIERICEILLKAQIMISRSTEQIKEYNIFENVTVLEIKKKELDKKVQENSISLLKVKLVRIDLFPEGNYDFNFHFFEMDPNIVKSTRSSNSKLMDSKSLKITRPNTLLILSNEPQNETLFNPIEFHAIEIPDNNKSFQDFTYSGSNLSNFQLQIYRDDILFGESQLENFLEMFLVNINLLKDINNSIFSFNWKLTCNFNHDILKELKIPTNNIANTYDTYLEFKFEFDALTLGNIFQRIINIFKDVLQTKVENQFIVEEILDHFKSIKETIKYILEKPCEQETESKCCNICSIF